MPLAASRPGRRALALTAALVTAAAGALVAAPAADARERGPVCSAGSCTDQLDLAGGDAHTWTVPAGVTSVRALLVSSDDSPDAVEGIVPVTPGEVLTVRTDIEAGGATALSSPSEQLLVARGDGSSDKASGVRLVTPDAAPGASATFMYVLPAVTTTTAIVLAKDHAVAGGSTTATATVTANGATDFAGGAVQLLVDGKASGTPVAVTAAGTTATAKLVVPATGVAEHQVSAAFTATDPVLASTATATPFTVLPATIPWTLVDEAGAPITSPLATPDVVAHATGQLPGATVRLEVKLDGEWIDPESGESATVADDGTVDVPIATPLFLTLFSDDFTKDATFAVRLVAVSKFPDTPDLPSTAKTITVPGIKVPVDLQVDPGPYRAGDDVDNAVRVTISWFDEEDPFLQADDIVDALDSGLLTVYLDRKPVDPQDIVYTAADEDTAVLTFGAPDEGGDHTVQAVLTFEGITGSPITSASKVRHFTVAPSSFEAALLDDDGNPVTTVHPGDTLHAAARGLLEGTVVDFDLHSAPVLLGSASANADGLAVATVKIPANATPGKHTLVVTATDVLGDEHVERVALTVVAAEPTPSATPVDGPLAATGSEVAPLAILGGLLLLVGAGLVLVRRRRA